MYDINSLDMANAEFMQVMANKHLVPTPEEEESEKKRLAHKAKHDSFIAELSSDLDKALAALPKECDGPLASRDFSDPARTLWRKATSNIRQSARTSATVAAAKLEAAKHSGSMTADNCSDIFVLAAFWLLVDLVGQGGTLGLGNGSSARDGAFGRLGKGRRQASDGACWCSAALAAYQTLLDTAHQGMNYSPTRLLVTFDEPVGVVVQLDGGDTVDRDDAASDKYWAMFANLPELFPLAGLALLSVTAPESCPSHADAWVRFKLTIEQAAQWFTDIQEACVKRAAEVNANPNLRW